MNQVVKDKLKDMVDLCKIRRVRRLALFGSAATDSFDQFPIDLDIIVEFKPVSPVQHADSYTNKAPSRPSGRGAVDLGQEFGSLGIEPPKKPRAHGLRGREG